MSKSLPTGAISEAVESSFKPDKFKGLRGPISVDPLFIKELTRIDPRLVLRYNPFQNLYMVWLEMAGGKLWGQPTHVIHNGRWGFRKPDKRDLKIIQTANYLAVKMDHHAKEKAAEHEDNNAIEKSKYARQLALQELTQRVAKKYDLTSRKFFDGDYAITRGAIGRDRSKMLETV